MLRPYQQQSVDSALQWVRQSIEPCLIEAPTGAGKSHIIAALAKHLHEISKGKHILCLAPSAELVTQNREKYIATGNPASIFSASAGGTCLRWPVVFGTPGTVKNKIRRFGDKFCAVIVDEAHGITPTIKHIIEQMRQHCPNLRVIGLSATPYRLGSGYIYAMDETGRPMGEDCCADPYFAKKVYTISAYELIGSGFLTTPVVGGINTDTYETIGLELNSQGKFDSADIDRAFHGHGRKTAAIVADVVAQSRNRRGVMFFAATIQHAQEVLASLPPKLSALITGKTGKGERAHIIQRFKARELKYLVNVDVLTKGFDAPHVDVIAILRATESVALLQQIIGRGLRIDDGKDDCLVLDYAQNIDRHCPDGDLFDPDIKANMRGTGAQTIDVICPSCGIEQSFSCRPNPDGFEINKNGYFLDLDGVPVETEHGDMPAHFGRRCQAQHLAPGGVLVRCDYRWTYKECPHCDEENDIAARYCCNCKGELVDPNEKLIAEFKALKRDPTRLQTDRVVAWTNSPSISRAGKETLRIEYVTEHRSFCVWHNPRAQYGKQLADYHQFCAATKNGSVMPATVTYRKNPETGFYTIHDYNRSADEIPAVA